ncbi:cob(I)yrinic acid a,c-diamide adenosyltransferase [Neokomagataea thailandica]|uniref:Corrinoid adenosyltransferase n=1 Tax=Neokomagataea tanensis NBRC 106556 TaxID=1223519 RepID=A0ABQ0QHH3_9PROT|nr:MULTISPECIES: cob(I)yrinic acid a,c-diamide adenosyltransferase [Neokomagataea]GBR45020.1 cobalamin adenosyltransferase [Neokomagataea tanensis NBRC 106556]
MAIRIDRVVTRGGDCGQTSLGDGVRVSKADRRVEAMGAVDELNAHIGLLEYLCRVEKGDAESAEVLRCIQGGLFDLGADICMPPKEGERRDFVLSAASIAWLEKHIEEMAKNLPTLTSFILPGGGQVAAQAHIIRTVTRRAERRLVALGGECDIGVRFLNRLSDYFFQFARKANDNGARDILWQPRQWS